MIRISLVLLSIFLSLLVVSSATPAVAQIGVGLPIAEACALTDSCRKGVGRTVESAVKVALRELRGEVAEYSTWPRSWKRCAKDPSTCADEFILRGVKKQARVLVTAYIEYLEAQAAQKTKRGLPAWFRKAAKPYYPGVDLSKVRYVEGVDTLHKQIITVGNVIFFPGKVNLKRTAGIQTMLHELEHVVQYKQRGSKHQLIYEYVAKIPFKMVSTGRFNVHDDLDMERAADAKADEAWRTVVAAIR